MSIQSEKVKRWRQNTKLRMVVRMGGKCQCCGYDKCADALDFHHIDQDTKDFSFSKVMAHCVAWERIEAELKKCVLICSNCHRELHAGMRSLPEHHAHYTAQSLTSDESSNLYDQCVCGNIKPVAAWFCSQRCAAKKRYDWSKVDVVQLIENGETLSKIAELVGCSSLAVSKKYRALTGHVIVRETKLDGVDLQVLSSRLLIDPVFVVAKRYGITDNSLRKFCVRNNITVPKRGRGYWTKHKFNNKLQ